jgi:lipopolysaccharide/colanic/teichoic acid biosynthesis glycosyltransferase
VKTAYQNSLIKRSFDFALALAGLIISSPLWAFFSILIYCEDKGPVFFIHKRCGEKEKIINVLKFRTMRHNPHADNVLTDIKDDPRVTRIGKILRATAMDELPTLINILRGDMSFVGPKALPFEIGLEERHLYENITMVPGYHIRSQVKPGLTGIAQIYASKNVKRKEKFHYDNLYVRKMNLWLDIRLVILSFIVTFKGSWESRTKKFS